MGPLRPNTLTPYLLLKKVEGISQKSRSTENIQHSSYHSKFHTRLEVFSHLTTFQECTLDHNNYVEQVCELKKWFNSS